MRIEATYLRTVRGHGSYRTMVNGKAHAVGGLPESINGQRRDVDEEIELARLRWDHRTIGEKVMSVTNKLYAAAVARIAELEAMLGLLAGILEAPTNRFGKLEFHADDARNVRNELLQLAKKYEVTPSRTIPEQAAKVARAVMAIGR